MSTFDRVRGWLGQRDGAPQSLEPVVLHPIGVVRSRIRDLRFRDTSREQASVHLCDAYVSALIGLDGFSHAIVLTWLDQVSEEERGRIKEHPAGDRSLPEVGVLALRTHHRPNPIGVSVVRIERLNGTRLDVIGLDVVDGTPVLDIKPYLPPYDSVPDAALPGWATGEDL